MDLLRLAIAVLAVGCYEPALHDCVTSCEIEADCPPGQTCGADGLCAAPAMAGRCTQPPPGDPVLPDAMLASDASVAGDAAIDAPPASATLRVRITDDGAVTVEGVGACAPPASDCSFAVRLGTRYTLRATPGDDRRFDRWESIACGGQGSTCSLLVGLPLVEVRAKFKRD